LREKRGIEIKKLLEKLEQLHNEEGKLSNSSKFKKYMKN
jgi:hypothetical protein